jgi:hypothetical protein
MKGQKTVELIASAIKEYGLANVPLEIITKTRKQLSALKTAELIELAKYCKVITADINGKTLKYSKEQWINLIAQYAELA